MARARARRAGWAGWAAALVSCLAVPNAVAATEGEVAALQSQPCAPYQAVHTTAYSAQELAAASAGDFPVMRGYPAELVAPVDWTLDPYQSRNWLHYLHGFTWIDRLLYDYTSSGDLAALAQARDLALDWIGGNPISDQTLHPLVWSEKVSGDRAPYLAFIARAAACEGMLTDEQGATMLDSLAEHAEYLSANHPRSNHGLFVDHGLALIADYLSFQPGTEAWLELARERFWSSFHRRFEEREGVWLEQSSYYQLLLHDLVESFEGAVGGNPDPGLVGEMEDAAGWMLAPNGRLAPLGDANQALETPGWLAAEAADDRGLRVFKRSGLAFVKRGRSYLAVTSWFHNRTHKQADDLGFHLVDRGREVITDTGLLSYDTDAYYRFARSARAHSVLTVDGNDLGRSAKFAYASGLRAAGEKRRWYAIQGVDPLLRLEGVHHRRTLLYRPGAALLVIDVVRSPRRHTYERRFQLAPGIAAVRNRRRVALRGDGFHGVLDAGGGRLTRIRGSSDPIGGWSFPDYRESVPRWTLEYASRGRSREYVTAIGLDGPAKARLTDVGRRRLEMTLAGRALRPTRLTVVRRHGRLGLELRARRR